MTVAGFAVVRVVHHTKDDTCNLMHRPWTVVAPVAHCCCALLTSVAVHQDGVIVCCFLQCSAVAVLQVTFFIAGLLSCM